MSSVVVSVFKCVCKEEELKIHLNIFSQSVPLNSMNEILSNSRYNEQVINSTSKEARKQRQKRTRKGHCTFSPTSLLQRTRKLLFINLPANAKTTLSESCRTDKVSSKFYCAVRVDSE